MSYSGQMRSSCTNSDCNRNDFQIRQSNAMIRTNTPVKVIAVHKTNQFDQYTVDVQPMINMQDREGTSKEHGTVYGIPMSNGCGNNGSCIVQPKVGDFGHMTIGDRDSSKAYKNKSISDPGSHRSHHMSDGIYYGGFNDIQDSKQQLVLHNDEQTQQLTVEIKTPGAVKITCKTFTLNASDRVEINGKPVDINK